MISMWFEPQERGADGHLVNLGAGSHFVMFNVASNIKPFGWQDPGWGPL